jgi:sulfide:quinone oxidoreductase
VSHELNKVMAIAKVLSRGFATYRPKVAIIGAGAGGLSLSTQLLREKIVKPSELLVVDSTPYHSYHGFSTMIAGGYFGETDKAVNRWSRFFHRPIKEVFKKEMKVLPSLAKTFIPEEKKFITENGDEIIYELLVLSPGLRHNFDLIEGAKEALADPNSNVASMFDGFFGGRKMNRIRVGIKEGTAVFANTPQPAKCGGAPLKICFLIEEYLKKKGIRDKVDVHFFNADKLLFPVPQYAAILDKLVKERNIITHYDMLITKIDKERRIATFQSKVDSNITQEIHYDALHIAPHFVPLSTIKASPFAKQNGYLDVDIHTLQHNKYKDVFCIGDGADIPTSKTAAAITAQTPVVVHNIKRLLNKETPNAKYNGYSVCPIFTGKKRMLFCETLFKEPYHSYLMPNNRPKWSYYFVSRYFMPLFYWWFVPRGIWHGKRFIFKPRYK